MSVRTEARDQLSPAMQQALHVSPEQLQMAGVPMAAQTAAPADPMNAMVVASNGPNEHALAEANSFNTTNPEHPLHRTMVVQIRASLNDLCLKKTAASWTPSAEATKAILQQRKFVDLSGNTEAQGDLKSIVLHDMTLSAQKSTFPTAVGMRVTGVDDSTYSITGDAYSAITMPGADTHVARSLQKDDTSLAYEFARKFPGYTSDNLSYKGIHEVGARRFCLVAADHPLVSAISENAEKLQMGEISMMPEGLVKISSSLYETIMPMVKQQVESQIKVRDFSKMQVTLAPADFESWSVARSETMAEAKSGLKAKLEAEMAAAADDGELKALRDRFSREERELEHKIDHEVHTFSATLDMQYNFLDK